MKSFGPGFLIAAAFIGPGTVTTATLAGANFGYTLLWAVLFSVVATLILQEMSARLGIASGTGLAECLNNQIGTHWFKYLVIALIVAAIGIGNAAYEAGNLTGAGIGLKNLLGGEIKYWASLLGAVAALLLATGRYEIIQTALTMLVLLMSLVFVSTLFVADIHFAAMFKGLLIPAFDSASITTIIALIGTTVVPYNLFLHASLAARYQPNLDKEQRLKLLRRDSRLAISIGGLITLAIVSTAAATWFNHQLAPDIHNLATQLSPILGSYAPLFFATGLFAAGLTSAITAPLATSYAICGALGWDTDMKSAKFKITWISIIVTGTLLCFLELKPLAAILLAQASNGLLLPLIAICLLWFANKNNIMQSWRNSLWQNLIAGSVILLVSGLGFYKVLSLF